MHTSTPGKGRQQVDPACRQAHLRGEAERSDERPIRLAGLIVLEGSAGDMRASILLLASSTAGVVTVIGGRPTKRAVCLCG